MGGNKNSLAEGRKGSIGFDKQNRLGGNRIVEFSSMGGIISAHADHFAQWQIDLMAINNMLIILHYITPHYRARALSLSLCGTGLKNNWLVVIKI